MPTSLQIKPGDTYGRLVILHEIDSVKGRRRFLCQCKCGNTKAVDLLKLRSGNTVSCGCWQKESRKYHTRTHGESRTRLYSIWNGMKERCLNPNSTIYQHYGGRGIKVCDKWLDYEAFREWAISVGYSDDLTLERKDVNGNYEPDNCCWIPKLEQKFNKRNSINLEIDGITKPLKKWSELYGIDYLVAYKRLKRGWDIKRALTEPVRPNNYSVRRA